MQDAIGVVDPLEIVIDLGAERAAGERMRRGAVQLPGGTVVHFYYPTARVRTVVPACTANDLDRAGRAHRAMIPSNLERPIMAITATRRRARHRRPHERRDWLSRIRGRSARIPMPSLASRGLPQGPHQL